MQILKIALWEASAEILSLPSAPNAHEPKRDGTMDTVKDFKMDSNQSVEGWQGCGRCRAVDLQVAELQAKNTALQAEVGRLREWIEKADHLDGCSRRNQPYPLRNKEEVCDCGRKQALNDTKEGV